MFDTCNISHSEFNVWKELFGLEWRTVDTPDMLVTNFWTVCKIQKSGISNANWSNALSGCCFSLLLSPKFTVHAEIFRQALATCSWYRAFYFISSFFPFTDTFSLHNESLNINTGFESHQSEFWKRMNCFSWTLFNIVYAYCCIYCAFIVCANIVVSLLFANIPLNQSHLFAWRVAPRTAQRPPKKKQTPLPFIFSCTLFRLVAVRIPGTLLQPLFAILLIFAKDLS